MGCTTTRSRRPASPPAPPNRTWEGDAWGSLDFTWRDAWAITLAGLQILALGAAGGVAILCLVNLITRPG